MLPGHGLAQAGVGVYFQAQAAQVEEETEASGFVAFHQQYPAPGQRRQGGAGRLGGDPDGEPEGGAHARGALEVDVAAHAFHQAAGDGQAEAGTFVTSGDAFVPLGEGLEDAAALFGIDADAGVADGKPEHHAVAVGPCLRASHVHYHLADRGVFDGVADEVVEDLFQAAGIAVQVGGHVFVHEDGQFQAFFVCQGGEEGTDIVQHYAQVEVHRPQVDVALLHLCQFQDVVDEGEQALGGVLDGEQVVPLTGVGAGLVEEAGETDDGIHGGADLVAHVGEETTFGIARRLCRPPRLVQLTITFLQAFEGALEGGGGPLHLARQVFVGVFEGGAHGVEVMGQGLHFGGAFECHAPLQVALGEGVGGLGEGLDGARQAPSQPPGKGTAKAHTEEEDEPALGEQSPLPLLRFLQGDPQAYPSQLQGRAAGA